MAVLSHPCAPRYLGILPMPEAMMLTLQLEVGLNNRYVVNQ